MEKPEKHTITILGSTTAYWSYGNSAGPTLICVHGFRGDHHGLEGMAQALPNYHVIVPDLPGFGRSDSLIQKHTLTAFATWLIAFADDVAPNNFSILGHSFGSLVVSAAISAGLTPDSLVLINPISSPALHGPRALLSKAAGGYYELGNRLPATFAEQLLRNPLIVRLMSETMAKTRNRELRAWIHAQHAQYFSDFTDRSSLLHAFRASVSHTVSDFSDAFSMPTLLIVGEIDDITPLTEQLKLAHLVDGAQLQIIPHVGHLIHYEAVGESAAHIDSFLTESLRA